jgi:hypothetical protein
MFQSHKYDLYLGKDTWGYELTDSEFGTVLGTVAVYKLDVEIGVVVIQEYSKRNLNVAANLVAAFVWLQKQYPDYSVQYFINDNRKYNPLFPPYEKDLQKYLVLQ